MENFIKRTNIAHFKDLLKAETDPAKRAVLLNLLADEEAKQARHVTPLEAPDPVATGGIPGGGLASDSEPPAPASAHAIR